MTQTKPESRRDKEGIKKKVSRQTELPLVRHSQATSVSERTSRSKIIFQLKSELNRLQQRDREWKLMFNMLSHDLKEPLLTLEGFTKLLDASGIENRDQKRYLKIIRESVSSLHLLVGSLQSISRLYQEPAEMTQIHLYDILNNVIVSLAEQIHRTKGKIVLPAKDVMFRGDPVRLYQIFLNLISNSLKYHRKSVDPQITISYRKDSKFHRISIKDNGVGIDQEDLKKLFVPFTRLEDVPTDGMGIGLSIVKRIAESFGGRVLVRSQHNTGTTFTVCLPRNMSARNMNTKERHLANTRH